eukprot:scaffold5216_cov36-Phaeocystis_antarctica.AAC.2
MAWSATSATKRSASQRIMGDVALPPMTIGTTRASRMSAHGALPNCAAKTSKLMRPAKNSSTTMGKSRQRGVSLRIQTRP